MASKASARTKARVLCLHGYAQNATFFRMKTGSLRKHCRNVADFSYVDAPHVATAHFVSERPEGEEERGSMLGWWRWKEENARAATSHHYLGFDDTLKHLTDFIDAEGPFDGVLGFSQGAALAAMLCSTQQPLLKNVRFKFAILIAGFVPRDPHYEALLLPGNDDESSAAAAPSMPTLHVYGSLDERVPPVASERLASCFAHAKTHTWEGGHAVPSGAEFRQALKAFIEQSVNAPTDGGGAAGSAGEAAAPAEPAAAAEAADAAAAAFDRWHTIRNM